MSGIEITRKAVRQPCMTIVRNTGQDASTIVEKILANSDKAFGYDALMNEFGNLIEKGIVDPTKVPFRL